ncbi:MAG: hypothetical protein ACKOUM_06145, partial [Sphingopyxis sp.]
MRTLALAPLVACALLSAACRDGAAAPAPAPTAPVDSANPLEEAASDANLVDDPNSTKPTGLYERRHGAGVDAICLTPSEDSAGDGGAGDDAEEDEDASGGTYRMGMVASFGPTLLCEGRGTA